MATGIWKPWQEYRGSHKEPDLEQKKVTIVSIIYQVEPYLRQCLESILKQTYKNLEILLIAGVSDKPENNDASVKICEEYAQKDARIKLISCPARGIADARNVGLSHVTGDLIAFVDGDDWVDDDFIASQVSSLEVEKSKIAVCGRYYEFANRTEADTAGDTVVMNAKEAMAMILNGTGFFLHLWDKLFVRSLFDGVTFPTDHVVEDRIIVSRILGSAEKICYNSSPKYHFRERSGSNSKKPGMEWHNAVANRMLCKYVTENFPELIRETGRFYLQETLTSLQNLLVSEKPSKEEVREFVEEIKTIRKDNKDNPLIGRTLKIKTMLALHCRQVLGWITKRHQRRDREAFARYR